MQIESLDLGLTPRAVTALEKLLCIPLAKISQVDCSVIIWIYLEQPEKDVIIQLTPAVQLCMLRAVTFCKKGRECQGEVQTGSP